MTTLAASRVRTRPRPWRRYAAAFSTSSTFSRRTGPTTRFWATWPRQRRSALTLFGQAITPNQHNLALNFVTLDNFSHRRGEQRRLAVEHFGPRPDVVEHQYPINYAQRGVSLDTEA